MKINISKRIMMSFAILGLVGFLYLACHFIYYQSSYLYKVFSEDSFPLRGISHTEHLLEAVSDQPSTFIGKNEDIFISAHYPSFNFDLLYMDKPILSLINYFSFFVYKLIPIIIILSYLLFMFNILRKNEYYKPNAKILKYVGLLLVFIPIFLLVLALVNLSFLPHELIFSGLNSASVKDLVVRPTTRSLHLDWIIIGGFLARFAKVISNSIKLKEENDLTV